MKEYGLTHEQLAYVAVAQRQWAAMNPRAMFREPITVDDVLASPLVAYPFHLLECCLVTDGGGALIVTSADRAGDIPQAARVRARHRASRSESPMISQMDDFTSRRRSVQAGRAAFAEAGIGPADVDHLMVYDAFAHVPIYGLEALGFVTKGEAGAFIADGQHRAGRATPDEHQRRRPVVHPHRDVRHVRHPGGRRQLRGEAPAQVARRRTISVILGNGGMFATCGVLVLARQPRLQRPRSRREVARLAGAVRPRPAGAPLPNLPNGFGDLPRPRRLDTSCRQSETELVSRTNSGITAGARAGPERNARPCRPGR